MARMQITSDSEAAAPGRAGPDGAPVPGAAGGPDTRQRPGAETTAPPDPARGERRALVLALLFSLLFHAGLLSLTFGGDGKGLPGLLFPWRDRRIEVPPLRIVLVPAQLRPAEAPPRPPAEPSLQATIEASGAARPAPAAPAPPARRQPAKAVAKGPTAKPPPPPKATRATVAKAPAPQAPRRSPAPDRAVSVSVPEAAVGDVEHTGGEMVVPAELFTPTAVVAVAPSASSPGTVTAASREDGNTAQEAQRLEAARQEAARVEAERLDAERQEATRQAAAQREAARVEAARLEAEREEVTRQEAARVEAERLEAERQEAERREASREAAVQQEAARQEVARQQAARAEAARLEAERQEAMRQVAAQQEAVRREAVRAESARLEAERQEASRQAAVQQEARRQEVARQEAARADAARLEAERQEARRQAAAQQEAARREAARAEAARLEAEREEASRQAAAQQEAARVEAVRAEAARQEAVRQAAARQEAARVEALQAEEKRREAVLRAIGRQLDEEADRRDAAAAAARQPNALPLSLSTARRVRLWARTDPNVELVQYAEALARKIQFNTTVETVRAVAKRPHTPPMVTVAVRSDGSVESVTFVVSSGVAEIDEAIRRMVESQRPYPAFPPAMARDFDVIEIRRTWYFDDAVRLQ